MGKTSIFLSTASRELSAIYSSYGAKLPFGWWRITCVALNQAVMITLDHMIFNNIFSDRIRPLSIGEHPLHTELNLIYMKDNIFCKEIQVLSQIIRNYVK